MMSLACWMRYRQQEQESDFEVGQSSPWGRLWRSWRHRTSDLDQRVEGGVELAQSTAAADCPELPEDPNGAATQQHAGSRRSQSSQQKSASKRKKGGKYAKLTAEEAGGPIASVGWGGLPIVDADEHERAEYL